MFLAGPQGRPLPSTVTMVTDLNNVQQTVYTDTVGNGATTNPIVPQNTQILQFYVDNPGEYITTVTSSGTTKQYWVSCGLGFGSGGKKISIDRTAEQISTNTSANPFNVQAKDDQPASVKFPGGVDTYGIIDFVMPQSFPLTLETVQLSTLVSDAPAAPCHVVWYLKWCNYDNGQPICNIATAARAALVVSSMGIAIQTRTDVEFLGSSVATANWPQNTHVIVAMGRDATDPRDTCADINGIEIENVQLEFSR